MNQYVENKVLGIVELINMNKNEFINRIESEAMEYAMDCVFDPEEHMNVVEGIATDFIEGAYTAYEFLTGETIE